MTKHNSIRKKNKTFKFKTYRYEIIILVLFLLGIFLLLEKMEIKKFIYNLLKNSFIYLGNSIQFLIEKIKLFVSGIETSDIVGYLLISIAIFMVLHRLRDRMINRKSFLSNCPKCNGSLHRIHRKSLHRIIGFILYIEVRNYSCKKCSFRGIRLRKY